MEPISKQFDENSFPEWTIEEFDAIREHHTFSPRYRRAMRQAVRHQRRAARHRFSFTSAVAAAMACVVLPIGVYAAVTHADFFQNAFGNAGRQSVASHEETIDNGKGGQITVTYPEREYVAIDTDAAEGLIGERIADEPLSVEINDHTLTIDSTVRDENALVMEFTITCDTGVKVFDYDALSNEAKGPQLSEEATFFFHVADTADNIYVDLEKTTETSLHGYYYGTFGEALADGEAPVLEITYTDAPYLGLSEDASIYEKQLEIPATQAVGQTAFTSETGGHLELSPISLKVDMADGFDLSEEESGDPANLRTLSIEYLDGSVYQVLDNDANIDNTSYLCEYNSEIIMIFNRLIDPAAIQSVTVNGIAYTVE